MPIGTYHLLAQLGAGADGASYRAADATGVPLEVRILGGAALDPGRLTELTRRLRLAVLLDHPAAIRVRELGLEQDPPFAVLEWLMARTLAEAFAAVAPPGMTALRIARDLCSALAEAHRLGLAHGRLSPSQIRLTDAGAVKLDFTGLDIGAVPVSISFAEFEASCRAPEAATGAACDAAADLYSLGMILYWLLRRPARSLGPVAAGHRPRLPAGNAHRGGVVAKPHTAAPGAADPADRPPVQSLLTQMAAEAVESADAVSADTAAGLPTPAAGSGRDAPERVGRFRLVQMLGEGGMGSVYGAEEHRRHIGGGQIAPGAMDDTPGAWQRLRKEARLLAEVNNPYVANLIEINEDEGTPYLVMEFVEGKV